MIRRTRSATELSIAGLVPCSMVDWPGRLVATVFTQGCPWSCVYCHNRAIIDPLTPGAVAWDDVETLLETRHGLLDGVVFSGGEPTRQEALVPAAVRVAEAGYGVGLHTAGTYPERLARLLRTGVLDWVGLDIKALPEDYEAVVARAGAGQRAWRSLDAVLASGVDVEVRVTCYPDGPDLGGLAGALRRAGVRVVALQKARGNGTATSFASWRPGWDERFRAICDAFVAEGFDDVVIRGGD
ncbi:anaerobic ribonucleoside-triphosphate reductase activating protein [Nanchangia anserum]|uniref:Anaerobic ribonucleoside-triphosphate reductase activating protein n=1 Tax=Nanchangia anserum TaxID=2692125 RepID=A0A8I0GGF9_9ACTO|nr:anaerobic ribonucleoside-triphosphate reductase activating protein [Nanchangia anserum]MBD3689569.1 anaerobic ribonucleoside-triphosphate reductase activating protein [Nanchangia anserum]QOX81754.1 anaerobic ribonucleoside-triphosphate reductase activating protein [Nanchangia anserum]